MKYPVHIFDHSLFIQNLCINESVLKLKSIALINEKCLDLQKQKKESNYF
jgi:hypothetical protein